MNDSEYMQRITLFLAAMRCIYEEARPGQDHVIIPEDLDAFTKSILETKASNPFADAFLCLPGVAGLRCVDFRIALTHARTAGVICKLDHERILIELSPRQAARLKREPEYPYALALARAYAERIGILPREERMA